MWLASERRTSPRPGGIVLARRVFLALCGENLRVLVSGPALIPQPRKSNGNARGEIPHARDPFSRAHRVRNRQLCMKGRGKNWIRLEAIDTGAMGGAVETGISREVIVIAALRHPGASQTHAVECTTQLMRCASCCPLPQRRQAGRHAVRLSVSPLVACRRSPVASRSSLVAVVAKSFGSALAVGILQWEAGRGKGRDGRRDLHSPLGAFRSCCERL